MEMNPKMLCFVFFLKECQFNFTLVSWLWLSSVFNVYFASNRIYILLYNSQSHLESLAGCDHVHHNGCRAMLFKVIKTSANIKPTVLVIVKQCYLIEYVCWYNVVDWLSRHYIYGDCNLIYQRYTWKCLKD